MISRIFLPGFFKIFLHKTVILAFNAISDDFRKLHLFSDFSPLCCIYVCFSPNLYSPQRIFFPLQSASNGVSKSVLRYEPTIEDDGRYLTCRAENAALRNTALEDQWTIQVHCKQLYCFYRPIPKIK